MIPFMLRSSTSVRRERRCNARESPSAKKAFSRSERRSHQLHAIASATSVQFIRRRASTSGMWRLLAILLAAPLLAQCRDSAELTTGVLLQPELLQSNVNVFRWSYPVLP